MVLCAGYKVHEIENLTWREVEAILSQYGRLKDQEMRVSAICMAQSVRVAHGSSDDMERYISHVSGNENEEDKTPTIEEQFKGW